MGFHTAFADLKLMSLNRQGQVLTARYQGGGMTVEATYTLHGENHFAEKQLALTCSRKCGLKEVVVSRPTFSGHGLHVVSYRYPKYQRKPGHEPSCTFFGRTGGGGVFTGLEIPFDASSLNGTKVVLQFAPSLKVAAGEKLTFEPAYFGVYRRGSHDKEQNGLPLRSESDAMVAMTSTILGPPRFGLAPMVNGWGSQMGNFPYTEKTLAEELKALDVMAQCGIGWYCEAHPWTGDKDAMSALGPDDSYKTVPLEHRFLAHAQQRGIKTVLFVTMNNSYPWFGGKPFRGDKPDWVIDAGAAAPAPAPDWRKLREGVLSAGGNCLGKRAFVDWLERINVEAVASGPYPGWIVDGDFFGGGGLFTTIVRADCQSDKHDHLPGDSNYACQRALSQLMASLRRHYPHLYISTARPPMDLGVWAMRNVDAAFTLYEGGTEKGNLVGGNDVRTWSRIRVHRDFFPHYIDQPLLFPPSFPKCALAHWPSEHLDYILLSALSSAPNQLYYLPLKSGFPDQDKTEIKKWLNWGRENIEYLQVRKDLPDWPAADKVDGSAHIAGNRGLIFLFNPSKNALMGEFALTEESIGLKATGNFQVSQEYPVVDRKITSASGRTIRWDVPPMTAVVLRLRSVPQ